ncbi:MAG: hypothetical protein DRN71_00230 [Candidatus Nanohalarchaeota archaeon]|nr:MAG: hypothetical protein DRN71_00230 [Candidatus Nanohaloarchaeota archaeon]
MQSQPISHLYNPENKHLTSNNKTPILKSAVQHSNILQYDVDKIKDIELKTHIDRILRAINDIEMEIINISFYEELKKKFIT